MKGDSADNVIGVIVIATLGYVLLSMGYTGYMEAAALLAGMALVAGSLAYYESKKREGKLQDYMVVMLGLAAVLMFITGGNNAIAAAFMAAAAGLIFLSGRAWTEEAEMPSRRMNNERLRL